MTPLQQQEMLAELSNQAIYLMGISFVLGSLFTIFSLLIMDMLKRIREEREESEESGDIQRALDEEAEIEEEMRATLESEGER